MAKHSRKKRPAALAPASTGLLIPRLHKRVPQGFGGVVERAAIEELMRLGAITETDTALSLIELLDKGVSRAIGWDDPPFRSVIRLEGKPTFGFSSWSNSGFVALGDLIQCVTEATNLVTGIAVGRYCTGLLNSHPFIGGPDRWKPIEETFSEHLEEDSDPGNSPTRQAHIDPDLQFFEDPDSHGVIARLYPEIAEQLDILKLAAPPERYDQILNDYTEFNGHGYEFHMMTGWSSDRCHLDHCLDACEESNRESGECYETVSCTLLGSELRGLGEVCAHLHAIDKLGEITWNLKPKETACFLKRLCSVTPDTPGQLLLSTASAPA